MTNESFPPMYIVGAGALGLRFALQCKAAQPVLVMRESAGESIVIRSVDATGHQLDEAEIRTRALASITEFPTGSCILLCTKVHALEGILEKIKPRMLGSETVVVCQNGLGVGDLARSVVSERNLVRLMAKFGAVRTSPGIIRPSGPVAVSISGFEDPASQTRAAEVSKLLLALGVEVASAASPIAAEWQKTTLNIVTNSIATILNGPNALVLDDPEIWNLVLAVVEECKLVAQTDGVSLDDDVSPDELRVQIERYRENTNSTLVDLRSGRATEIPWLIGAMVKRAEAARVAVPISKTLFTLLSALERSGVLKRQ